MQETVLIIALCLVDRTHTTMNKNNNQPKIPDWQLCKGCRREKVSVVLSPCRHLAACNRCSYSMTRCPVCSKPVGSAAVRDVKLTRWTRRTNTSIYQRKIHTASVNVTYLKLILFVVISPPTFFRSRLNFKLLTPNFDQSVKWANHKPESLEKKGLTTHKHFNPSRRLSRF
jgi:hypothetical protein